MCKWCWIPDMTPAESRLGLRATTVNRLRRSTSEVRLALPYSNLKVIRRLPNDQSSCDYRFRKGVCQWCWPKGYADRGACAHSAAVEIDGQQAEGATGPGFVRPAHRRTGRWSRDRRLHDYRDGVEGIPQSAPATRLLTSGRRYRRQARAFGRFCRHAPGACPPSFVRPLENSHETPARHRDADYV